MTTVYAHVPAQALIVSPDILTLSKAKEEIRVLIFSTSYSLWSLLESR